MSQKEPATTDLYRYARSVAQTIVVGLVSGIIGLLLGIVSITVVCKLLGITVTW